MLFFPDFFCFSFFMRAVVVGTGRRGFESAAGDGWVSADGIGGHGSFRAGSGRRGGGEEAARRGLVG